MNSPSILARARRSDIRLEPFPHLVIRDALPPDFYRRSTGEFPPSDYVIGEKARSPDEAYRVQGFRAMEDPRFGEPVKAFFDYHTSHAFFDEMIALWKPALERLYGDTDRLFGKPVERAEVLMRQRGAKKNPHNTASDLTLECQFVINSAVEEVSTVRGAHIDNPAKLFAAILSCREEEDDTGGGDLALYRAKTRNVRFEPFEYGVPDDRLELVDTVPYGANNLIVWLNSPDSIHGVTPRSVTSRVRRYINFAGERFPREEKPFFPCNVRRRSLLERAIVCLDRRKRRRY